MTCRSELLGTKPWKFLFNHQPGCTTTSSQIPANVCWHGRLAQTTLVVGRGRFAGDASLYPFGTPLSASQARNSTAYGVLKLTLRSTGYDWQFVPVPGSTFTDSGSGNCH